MLTRSTKIVACFCAVIAGAGCRTSPQAKEAKYLQRGNALVASKDYARALLEFRNASSAMPKDAEPHYRMGMAYLETGDAASAIRAFQRATALDPNHAAAQLKMAELMMTTRDPKLIEAAVARLEGTFGPTPNNPEVIDALAMGAWKLGKPEDALQYLEDALQKFPTHLQSSVTLARMKLNQGDSKGAEEVLKKAVDGAPQSSPAALAMGELYLYMRQPAKAEVEIRRALQLDAKNGVALKTLAMIQMSGKRMDEAEQTFKQLSAFPDKAYKPLHAIFLFQTGKKDAALAEFEALSKAEPNDREARSRLVSAYFEMNRIAEAETVLAAALKRNAKDTDALMQRAALRLRGKKTNDAERDLKDILHFSPDSVAAHFMLAEVYRVKGLQNNQQQELQQALRLNPRMLQARTALEVSFLSAKQNKAALAVMDEAPEAQKKQAAWIIGRNWALLSMGNLREAAAGIDQAIQQGRPPEAVFQGAVLRAVRGEFPAARAYLDELLKAGVPDLRVPQLMIDTYVQQKDLAGGEAWLKAFVGEHSNSAELQQMLGQWYLNRGNSDAAQKAFDNAKKIDPQFLTADLSLAELDIRERRNDAARQRLGAVISADPQNIVALLLSARAEEAAGDRSAEMAHYRAVLNVDPANLIALNNLAYRLAPEDPDEALKLAQQAAQAAPNNANVQDTLGWVYYRKGLYSMAVRCLKTAVEAESTPRRQFHLGMSYLKVGDQSTGQKIVSEALLKDPNLAKTEQGW